MFEKQHSPFFSDLCNHVSTEIDSARLLMLAEFTECNSGLLTPSLPIRPVESTKWAVDEECSLKNSKKKLARMLVKKVVTSWRPSGNQNYSKFEAKKEKLLKIV